MRGPGALVFFVPLAPLSDAGHIMMALAQALDLPFGTGEGQQDALNRQVIEFLSRKDMLLIMDNFEHLLDGAYLVGEILQSAQWVRILATSRERLHLKAEHLYQIPGLEYPAEITDRTRFDISKFQEALLLPPTTTTQPTKQPKNKN